MTMCGAYINSYVIKQSKNISEGFCIHNLDVCLHASVACTRLSGFVKTTQ